MSRPAPKRAGERVEAAVVQEHSDLEYTPDSEAVHHDATTTAELTVSDDLRILGAVSIPAETPVEIKSAAAAIGETSRAGRFHVQRTGHEWLLDRGGVYLLAVCEPNPDREVVASTLATAEAFDELLGRWVDPGDGRTDEYAQLAWTNAIERETVEDRAN